MRKDQYIIKNSYRKPIIPTKLVRSRAFLILPESYTIDSKDNIQAEGCSLCRFDICQAILCCYSKLKQDGWGNFEDDTYFLMEDFDKVATLALSNYPILEKVMEYKIDGKQNIEIQRLIEEQFHKKHSLEYISYLWRQKIPQLIADKASELLLNWHYLVVEKGTYKTCSRCGQTKLAHSRYFSKNKTSKDGWYSICKRCRSKGGKEE